VLGQRTRAKSVLCCEIRRGLAALALLQNRQAARSQGFESPPLRLIPRALNCKRGTAIGYHEDPSPTTGGLNTLKNPWKVPALAICPLLVLSFEIAGCGVGEGDQTLIGVWTDPDGVVEFEVRSDGTSLIRTVGQEEQTTCAAKDGTLSAVDPDTG
jgi:hypothetical protein